MKKLFLAIILIFSLVTPTFTHAASTSLVLKVNNKQLKGTNSPFISNGTTYVPLKEITKQMGSSSKVDKNKAIVELSGLRYVTVTVGKSTASIYDSQLMSRDRTRIVPLKTEVVNGEKVDAKVKAISKNGQIFVPVEFISSLNGMNYFVETVKGKTKRSIYVGEMPSSLQKVVKKYGYETTEYSFVHKLPSGINGIDSLVKNQQVYVYASQGEWYKIKVGKQIGYVKKSKIKIGKSPAKGKMYSDGWFTPVLKSKWNKDPQVNYKTLERELGFTNDGSIFGIYGQVGAIQVIEKNPKSSDEVGIRFSMWGGNANGQMPQAYRIPIIAKELFKLYFGKDATRVWNYLDKGDIPDDFKANGRKVHASVDSNSGVLYLTVGHKK